MKRNFGVKNWMFPMPVLMIGTYNEDGTPNMMNAAWGGITLEDQITICIDTSHRTWANIAARKAFTVAFGTADTGGSMYPAGAAVSQVWTNNVEGVKCNTQTSTGSFQNCQDVSTGEVDVAVATSDVVLNAYNGTGKFADIGKLDNLRVIGAVYTSVLSGVALKSSGLTYIHDLLGKRVAVGPAASATENATLAAFDVMGIDSSNTSLENLGLGDGADSVGDGILDAAFGFGVKEGNSSNFAGSGVEVMKSPYLGKNGHIAVKTNSIPRAAAELAKNGFTLDESTAKYKGEKMVAVYLKQEFGGFAVHLLQK